MIDESQWPSVAEMPLHSTRILPGAWWACEFPERPPARQTHHDFRCRACFRHAEASFATDGTTFAELAFGKEGAASSAVPALAEMLAAGRRWFEERGIYV